MTVHVNSFLVLVVQIQLHATTMQLLPLKMALAHSPVVQTQVLATTMLLQVATTVLVNTLHVLVAQIQLHVTMMQLLPLKMALAHSPVVPTQVPATTTLRQVATTVLVNTLHVLVAQIQLHVITI